MANPFDAAQIADITKNILVRPLTGKIYSSIFPDTYDNIYEWVRFKVEEAAADALDPQDAYNDTYLHNTAVSLMKDQVISEMNNW